jgi:uncharacterized repeat protein (TIGR03803 family)
MLPSRFLVVVFISLAVVFSLASVTGAQTVTTLVSFSGLPAVSAPTGPLTQGRDGLLYGTSLSGGILNLGTVYKINTFGRGNIVYTFEQVHGANPYLGVMLATDGTFYTTTQLGGASGFGVVDQISKSGVATLLHDFDGGYDEREPWGAPVEASDGNLYGAVNGGSVEPGAVYKLTASGIFSTIHNFTGYDGFSPQSSLIQAADGKLYGTTNVGGASNCGTIVKLTLGGTVKSTYSFPCGNGGANPSAPLVQATDGNFYGTTLYGGTEGEGTIFKMTAQGVVSILHNFGEISLDGASPNMSLVQGTDGNLYGITQSGGNGYGTIFQTSLSGDYKVLYAFTLSEPNANPAAGLLQHTNGLFYGTTAGGYLSDPNGTVYSLDMGLDPFVTFVLPVGRPGQTAQILGQGLTGTTSVTFNGVEAASFKVVSDTYMTAVVPAGATTGAVVVATPAGNLSSNVSFRISK